jgi:hypothetical protein
MTSLHLNAQRQFVSIGLALLVASISPEAKAQKATVTIQAAQPGKPVSPNLFGISLEDLNHGAEGGL